MRSATEYAGRPIACASLLYAALVSSASAFDFLPAQRVGLPVPVAMTEGKGIGHVGLGRHVAMSTVVVSDTVMGRKPRHGTNLKVSRRVQAILSGVPLELVPANSSGHVWHGYRDGELTKLVLEGDAWILTSDALEYTFRQLSGDGNAARWWLTRIADLTSSNQVLLDYAVENQHGTTEVRLTGARYNFKAANGLEQIACPKHTVTLRYRDSAETLRLSPHADGRGFDRVSRILDQVMVEAATDEHCREKSRLSQLDLVYQTDPEYQLPRLSTTQLHGKTGSTPLPGDMYQYGQFSERDEESGFQRTRWTVTDTIGGILTHEAELPGEPAVAYSEQEFLAGKKEDCQHNGPPFPPPGCPPARVSGRYDWLLNNVSYFEGQSYKITPPFAIERQYDGFFDVTGDGLPDQLFHVYDPATRTREFWYRPNESDDRRIYLGNSRRLFRNLTPGAPTLDSLHLRTTMSIWADDPDDRSDRQVMMGTSSSTWVKLVDYNLDGRLDLLDARKPGYWQLYLNTPGTGNDIVWKYFEIAIASIRDAVAEKLNDRANRDGWQGGGGHLPLEFSVAGARQSVTRHYAAENELGPYSDVCSLSPAPEFCSETPYPFAEEVRLSETYTLLRLGDFNGDGFADLLVNDSGAHISERVSSRTLGPTRDAPPPQFHPHLRWTKAEVRDRGIDLPETNGITVYLNRAGSRLSEDFASGKLSSPFHPSVALGFHARCEAIDVSFVRRYEVVSNAFSLGHVKTEAGARCGLRDVNGDGFADRVYGSGALLGNGLGLTSTSVEFDVRPHEVRKSEPVCGPGSEAADYFNGPNAPNRERQQWDDPDVSGLGDYHTAHRVRLRDFNADGYADFFRDERHDHDGKALPAGWYLGTGSGTTIRDARPVIGSEWFGQERRSKCLWDGERLKGAFRRTTHAYVDINGDGRLDYLASSANRTLRIEQLVAEDDVGALSANRLREVITPDGGGTEYRYANAKLGRAVDGTAHDVPHPEIVLADVRQYAVHGGVKQHFEPTRYAYGDIRMWFDSRAGRWVSSGYAKTARLRGIPAAAGQVRGRASLTERYAPATGINSRAAMPRLGRVKWSNAFSGLIPADPRRLLSRYVPGPDVRRERTTFSVNAVWKRSSSVVHGWWDDDCAHLARPYDLVGLIDRADRGVCTWMNKSYLFRTVTDVGEASSIAGSGRRAHVTDSRSVIEVDVHSRPTRIRHDGDRKQLGDEYCEVVSYARPLADIRVDLVATRRLEHCDDPGKVYHRERTYYDGEDVAHGYYRLGRVRTSQVDRYDVVSPGDVLGTRDGPVLEYNPFGQVFRVSHTDESSDRVRTTLVSRFDSHHLLPLVVHESASDVENVAFVTRIDMQDVDRVLMAPLVRREHRIVDGFDTFLSHHLSLDEHGRVIKRGVGAPLQAPRLLSITEYFGDSGVNRHVRVRRFRDGVAWDFPYSPDDGGPSERDHEQWTVTHTDSIRRTKSVRRSYSLNGAVRTYRSGLTSYDTLGRLAYRMIDFVEDGSPPDYGRSYFYDDHGRLECTVDAHGMPERAALPSRTYQVGNGKLHTFPSSDSDPAIERVVHCSTVDYEDRKVVVRTWDPFQLRGQSEASGSGHWAERSYSATGRLEQAGVLRRENGAVVASALVRYEHDRVFGNAHRVTRFRDPRNESGAVTWSWNHDNLGGVLRLVEPGVSVKHFVHDDRGNLVERRWRDARDVLHRNVTTFDGLGRVTAHQTLRCADADESCDHDGTLTEYHYDRYTAGAPDAGLAAYAAGRLTEVVHNGTSRLFGYDSYGQLYVDEVRDETGARYRTRDYRSGLLGPVLTRNLSFPGSAGFPNGEETIAYDYHPLGPVTRMMTHDRLIFDASSPSDIDALGRYVHVRYGNGVDEHFVYGDENGRGLLVQHRIGGLAGEVDEHVYDYRHDVLGRIEALDTRQHRDGRTVIHLARSMAYDDLGRLVREKLIDLASGNDVVGNVHFDFDGLGQLARIDDLSGPQASWSSRLFHPMSGYPDRFCKETIAPFGSRTLPAPAPDCDVEYDDHGDMVRLGVRRFAYDSSRRLVEISSRIDGVADDTIRYRYGAGGAEVEAVAGRRSEDGIVFDDPRTDRHFGPSFERSDWGRGEMIERRIPGPTGVVLRLRGLSASGTPLEWIYQLGDDREGHLNLDEAANVTRHTTYGAMGVPASRRAPDGSAAGKVRYGFNGGLDHGAFGVTHIGARAYVPGIGRFTQRDPQHQAALGPQSNPYSFPTDWVNLADPTGATWWSYVDALGQSVGHALGLGFTSYGGRGFGVFMSGVTDVAAGAAVRSEPSSPPGLELGAGYAWEREAAAIARFDFDLEWEHLEDASQLIQPTPRSRPTPKPKPDPYEDGLWFNVDPAERARIGVIHREFWLYRNDIEALKRLAAADRPAAEAFGAFRRGQTSTRIRNRQKVFPEPINGIVENLLVPIWASVVVGIGDVVEDGMNRSKRRRLEAEYRAEARRFAAEHRVLIASIARRRTVLRGYLGGKDHITLKHAIFPGTGAAIPFALGRTRQARAVFGLRAPSAVVELTWHLGDPSAVPSVTHFRISPIAPELSR